MDMTNNSKRSLAIAAAAAVVLGGSGVLLGRTVFAPAASDSAAAPRSNNFSRGPSPGIQRAILIALLP